MSQKYFKQACKELEALGYSLMDYEPENKYAVYFLNGKTKTIGAKK
jgi:hypothetical protein